MPSIKRGYGIDDYNDVNTVYSESEDEEEEQEELIYPDEISQNRAVPSRYRWFERHIDEICEIWKLIKEKVHTEATPILERATLEDFVRFVLRFSYQIPYDTID